MNVEQVLSRLQALANPEKIALKQRKFGIVAINSLGIYHADLKKLAAEIGTDDELALALFDTGIYEARILCSKLYNPKNITDQQMETWASDFENWEICDSFCMGFFVKSRHALDKARQWSHRDAEFIKRAGFTIMAAYGFAHKNASNRVFEEFLTLIQQQADDERLYVRKAVNWALRNVGKRNKDLLASALATADNLLAKDCKSANWIARNAIAELKQSSVKMLDYPRHLYRKTEKIDETRK